MLNLTDEQVKKLEEFIQELPTKYGLPLLNLLRSFSAENAPKPVSPKAPVPIEAE